MVLAPDATGDEVAAPARRKLPHYPGLDGVRGLAALGVLFFHGGFEWARGGYLGVSLFFTLSGFLITRLLLDGYAHAGRVDFVKFWGGRLRRLAPALLVMLGLVIVLGLFVWDANQRAALAGDVESSLAYVANWRFLFSGHSYSDLFSTPSPLQHCWSIAVEEQFYLVFPVIVAVTLKLAHGSRRVLRRELVVLAGIALVLPFVLANHDRIYYGTDTRAFEILAGCLLAFPFLRTRRPEGSRVAAGLGLVALVATLVMWSTVGQTQDWLYTGGFALVALVNVAMVHGAIVPGPVRTVMSVRPLRYVGKISYGLYLYHWPIFLWLDAERTGLAPVPLFFVRCAITFALATASFVFLEMPIRERRMFRSWSYGAALATSVAIVLVVAIAFVPTRSEAKSTVGQDLARNLPVATTSPTAVTTERRPLRVYIYGDSTGDQFALGLYEWSLTHPGTVEIKANVHHTCALADFAGIRFNPDGDAAQDVCEEERAMIPADLDTYRPDVAYVISGPSNTTDVRLPDDDTWRALGDPLVDQFMADSMANLSTVFAQHGVPTVWFDLPYSDRLLPSADVFVANDRGRIDRYNELIAQLVAAQPSVTRLDWAEHINALTPEEDVTLRVDGVHVLPQLLGGLLDDWLWQDLVDTTDHAAAGLPPPPPTTTSTVPTTSVAG